MAAMVRYDIFILSFISTTRLAFHIGARSVKRLLSPYPGISESRAPGKMMSI